MTKPMTIAQAKAAIKALGLVGKWDAEWQQWRVTVPPGSMSTDYAKDNELREGCATYADRAEDAVDNANAMRRYFDTHTSWLIVPLAKLPNG